MRHDGAPTTRELRQAEELDALAPEWWALWRRLPRTTPFQSPAWLVPWWRSFMPGELRTIAVEAEDGRLVGLAPLYLETGPLGRRLLPVGVSLSDYLDWLLDPACAEAAGAAIMAHLAATDWPWEVMELQELPPGAAALSLAAPPGLQESAAAHSACPVLPLPQEGAWTQALSWRKRRSLRNARNRAARQGAQCRRAGAEEAQAFLDALYRVHGARWQSRGMGGVLHGEEVRRFHRGTVGGLAEWGLARLYTLSVDGRPVGAYYGFQHGGLAMAYLMGFDPGHGDLSPGTLLLGHAIDEAVKEGAREFHFLRGREAYKYGWGAQDRWNRRRLFRRERAA